MRIIDGTNRLLRAPPVTFQASEIGEEAFGWNIPNEPLLASLQSQIDETKEIQQFASAVSSYETSNGHTSCALDGGDRLCAKLVIGADGRGSKAREAAGIELRSWTYRQTAMVLAFSHSRSHSGISTEFHTETGPFTLVPLPGSRSSLVWVMDPASVAEFEAMPDAGAFSAHRTEDAIDARENIGGCAAPVLSPVRPDPGEDLRQSASCSPAKRRMCFRPSARRD